MERRRFLRGLLGSAAASVIAFIGLSNPKEVAAATSHKQLRFIIPYRGNPLDRDRYADAARIALEVKLRKGTSERFWVRYLGSDGSTYWRPVEVYKFPNGTNMVEFYHGNHYQFEDGEYL